MIVDWFWLILTFVVIVVVAAAVVWEGYRLHNKNKAIVRDLVNMCRESDTKATNKKDT